MTAADHDRLRELTAGYVLGALGPDDRAAIEGHLQACEACRQDVVDFAPLPALLGRVPVDDLADRVEDAVTEIDDLVAVVRADVAHLDRSRRRWQQAAIAVAAAAAVVVGAVLVAGEDDPVRRSDGVVLAVEASSTQGTANVVADERAWGTYLHVSAADLPPRHSYAVWTVDRDGAWEPVGSWAPTPDGRAELGCSTALARTEIDRVVITSDDRADELVVAR